MKQSVFFLLLFFSIQSFGQIVNIEKKRTALQDSIYWLRDVSLGVALLQNTKQVINIDGSIRIDHIRHKHTFLSLTSYHLGRVDKEDFVNKGFQHLRYNYLLNKRWTWEAFTQVQYNERLLLQMRWLLGTGPRLALLLEEKYQLYFGVLYMYEYNEEKTSSGELLFFRDHRMSSYLNLHWQIGKGVELSSTSYFQPLVQKPSDLRLSTETALNIQITKRLRYHTVFTYLYDSTPPEGVPSIVYASRNGLRWMF